MARCTHYFGKHGEWPRARCEATAEVFIYGPDGEPVPGGYLCREHGEMINREYREKLGEEWPIKPLISDGRFHDIPPHEAESYGLTHPA